ncbi:MAG: energy transducer TonB [Bacteroidota bacterium]
MPLNIALPGWVVATAMLGLLILTIAIILFLRREFHTRRTAPSPSERAGGEDKMSREDCKPSIKERSEAIRNRTKYKHLQVFTLGRTFFSYGLFVAASCSLLAISWEQTNGQSTAYEYVDTGEIEITELPPVLPPPAPPPPPPAPPVIDEVEPEELLEDPPAPPSQSFDDLVLNEPPPAPEPTAPPAEVQYIPPPPMPEDDGEIMVFVERMPLFPGCDENAPYEEQRACAEGKLMAFLSREINYPAIALENGQSGTAVVRFVIEKDGSVTNAEVIRDPGARLGDEALRVVELMQSRNIKWVPGNQAGRPVRVQFNLPVKFRLE